MYIFNIVEDINHYMCLYLSVITLKSDCCSPLSYQTSQVLGHISTKNILQKTSQISGYISPTNISQKTSQVLGHISPTNISDFPKIFAYKASHYIFTQKYLYKSLPGFGTHLSNQIFSYI